MNNTLNNLNDSENMIKIHNCIINIMIEIHKICIENNLKYTLMGGSLLGSIRHNGFIPWDDDMDIGLLYDDYIKLIEILKNTKHEWLTFDYPGCKDYEEQFMKVYDSRTMLKEKNSKRIKGVFVDVFPIIPIANTYKTAKKRYYRDALMKMVRFNKTNNSHSKWYKMFIYKFLGIFSSKKRLDLIISKNRKKYSIHKEYNFYCDPDGDLIGIVDKKCFNEFIFHKFENQEFMIIKEYDTYLKHIFGDYMKLPPVDKQIPSHFEILDFNKSYLEL